jgi:hypothetical protein
MSLIDANRHRSLTQSFTLAVLLLTASRTFAAGDAMTVDPAELKA